MANADIKNHMQEALEWKHWSGSTGVEALEWKHWSGSTGVEALEWNLTKYEED